MPNPARNPEQAVGLSQALVLRDLAVGASGAVLWVVLELGWVLLGGRDRLSGVWELERGVLGLLPAWILLAAPVGAFFALSAGPLVRAMNQGGSASRVLVLCAALFAGVSGYGMGGGRHLSSVEARLGFALVLAGLGALLLSFALRLLPLVRRGFSEWSLEVLAVVCFAVAVAAAFVNATVLVRLYPAFHGALSVISVGLSGLGAALLLRARGTREESPPQKRPALAMALPVALGILVSAGAVVPASRSVSGFDNVRYLVTEGSNTLALGVRFASRLAPPPPLDRSLADRPLGSVRAGGGADLRQRDILLISIDALRADHLGLYKYARDVSPHLDALGRGGVVFEAAYAPTPHTSYSITSLMTGKYMRPLLLQGAGGDSDLWAGVLRAYGYRTAAFYPPAVFYIDPERFLTLRESHLGFEFAKVEFAEGEKRVNQYATYLERADSGRRLFTWVHLFGPHEPYVKDPRFDFGDRDLDLYDSEIRAADETVGRLVDLARKRDPNVLILITADHGEEFGEHGGRYHGTTVYEEQVRVPLIIQGSGVPKGVRVREPVQTIDLLPTVLDGLKIPVPPRIRGRSLLGLLERGAPSGPGRAVAETDEYTLLAEGQHRLICQRKTGACRLFDLEKDPSQSIDISGREPALAQTLRETAYAIAQTHGEYESEGLRAEGKNWPGAILRGVSGDASVAPELARLLDDANVAVRRKAAELLFEFARDVEGPALRLALSREEDQQAREFLSLALTRLGQGAPLVRELLAGEDVRLRRLAALALAEQGDDLGEEILIDWWAKRKASSSELEFSLARRVLLALAKIRSKESVPYLVRDLEDVRLRPHLAACLAEIGHEDARPYLAQWLLKERYHSIREPLASALVELGGEEELILPLRHFLGVPDRLSQGVEMALRAGVLEDVGGPSASGLRLLGQLSDSGVAVQVIVPAAPRGEPSGVRLIVRAACPGAGSKEILVQPGRPRNNFKKDIVRARNQPEIGGKRVLKLSLSCRGESAERIPLDPGAKVADSDEASNFTEVSATLPEHFSAEPGHPLALELFAPPEVQIQALVAVPLRSDLPPPPPEPWEDLGAKKKP